MELKTVRHQDISSPLKKSVKSAPHFLSNIKWVKIGKQEPWTPFSKLLDPRLMIQICKKNVQKSMELEPCGPKFCIHFNGGTLKNHLHNNQQ
jgi:hypothetical protein